MSELTGRALAGEFEPVQYLEAPEVVALPDELRRSQDGRSVCTRPGSARYATSVQLSLEERLVLTRGLRPQPGSHESKPPCCSAPTRLPASLQQAPC